MYKVFRFFGLIISFLFVLASYIAFFGFVCIGFQRKKEKNQEIYAINSRKNFSVKRLEKIFRSS